MNTNLMTRHDFEVLAMGAFSAGSMTLYLSAEGRAVGEAVMLGLAGGCGACASVYALGVVARTLPAMAAPAVDFARLVTEYNFERARMNPPQFKAVAYDAPEGEAPPAPHRVDLWRAELRRFLLAGRMLDSFSRRAFTANGYTSDTAYRVLNGVLVDNGILQSGKAGTVYAEGYSYGRAVFTVKNERLTLPEGAPLSVVIGK